MTNRKMDKIEDRAVIKYLQKKGRHPRKSMDMVGILAEGLISYGIMKK